LGCLTAQGATVDIQDARDLAATAKAEGLAATIDRNGGEQTFSLRAASSRRGTTLIHSSIVSSTSIID
jgi:hypothetical protein